MAQSRPSAHLDTAPLSRLERQIIEYLASCEGRVTTTTIQAALERRTGEPVAEGNLRWLLARLVEVGVLCSTKGRHGGYRLGPQLGASEVA